MDSGPGGKWKFLGVSIKNAMGSVVSVAPQSSELKAPGTLWWMFMMWSSVCLSDKASSLARAQAEAMTSGEKNELCSMFSQVWVCVNGKRVSKVFGPSV